MQTKGIGIKALLVVSTVILMFTNAVTYMLLLSKNKEWKSLIVENNNNAFIAAEGLSEHVYYDGDSIPQHQEVKHYSRYGKFMRCMEIGELLHGDKVIMLLTANCCLSCASSELDKLQDLAGKIGRDKVVLIADYDMYTLASLFKDLGEEGYYETDTEHLGLKGSPTREAAMLMLVQDGRVKTSFPVMPQTSAFADWFHEYLLDYFKGKK